LLLLHISSKLATSFRLIEVFMIWSSLTSRACEIMFFRSYMPLLPVVLISPWVWFFVISTSWEMTLVWLKSAFLSIINTESTSVLNFLSHNVRRLNLCGLDVTVLRRQSRSLRNHITSRKENRSFCLFVASVDIITEESVMGHQTWLLWFSIQRHKETFVMILMCLHLHCTIFNRKETISLSLLPIPSFLKRNRFTISIWHLNICVRDVWTIVGVLDWKFVLHY